MNSISGWFCSNNSKNLFVKVVHPGGHVELHDRPIQAAELLNRNPKCCVAHHTVFQQPHAIISPNTTLTLGQKYYIVPLGTIRKLQLKHSPSVLRANRQAHNSQEKDDQDDKEWDCWSMRNFGKDCKKTKKGKSKCFDMSPKIKTKGSSMDSEKKNRKSSNKDSSSEGASPARLSLTSMNNWHPGLESITEEYSEKI